MTQQIDRETELVALMAAILSRGRTEWTPLNFSELALELLEAAIEKVNERRGVESSYEALEVAAFRASEIYPSAHPKAGRFITLDEPERLRELYRVVRQAQKGRVETT